MNLNILTNNLVVLDTKETEESLYFGTAFYQRKCKNLWNDRQSVCVM